MELTGRHAECAALDLLLASIRSGESRPLLVHGEAGVGKSALLEYLAEQAVDCRIARAAGVESEMELAFAGLHQLCAPTLDRLDELPGPQRDALRTAFGLGVGPAPDRFLIGLAVLGLLSEAAAEKPLVCLVDDAQWLDTASAQVLAFVARRLAAESVGLVFAARVPSTELARLPQLAVTNLREADARAVLDAALTLPLDAALRDRIVAETRGNPLALVEVPRALASPELAGGYGLPGSVLDAGDIEEGFKVRFQALPDPARRLLILASAETVGDPSLVWRAAASMGIAADAATAAAESGLADFGVYVRFRHPLARSVVYRAATVEDRRQAHLALAETIDPKLDPDRRAWHRAHAAPGPDEDVADELEASAGRARARGGVAAAAAFLERSTMLTVNPARRAARAVAAASAKAEAGALADSRALLAIAAAGPLEDLQYAQVDLVRAQLAFIESHGSDVPPLMLNAARKLEPIDANLARATYLRTFSASIFAGRFSVGAGSVEVARAAGPSALELPNPTAADLLLLGLATHFNDGYAAALPILRSSLAAFTGLAELDEIHWLWLAFIAAVHVWDDESWCAITERYVETARTEGALSELPLALNSRTLMLLFAGELAAAEGLTHETDALIEATGSGLARFGPLCLAAFRGDEPEAAGLTDFSLGSVTRRGAGIGITLGEWANAVLNNGFGRYDRALAAAQRATAYPPDLGSSVWAMVELVEAAALSGNHDEALAAYHRLAEQTTASGTDWGLGVDARCHALVARSDDAERLYVEAIDRLGRTRMKAELARAHLLYGEWLVVVHRRRDARTQLRIARNMLEAMGMQAFAERARRALRAAGETARGRKPVPDIAGELTAQESQIARMARDGLSNPEIGARLFISSRTVQYHLRKVFAKLGITSRNQLQRVLADAS